MKFKRMYDEYTPDYEEVYGDYLVDEQGYESLTDLLKRCIRDNLPIPERSPGLVEDYEVDADLEINDRIDASLFPEDYTQPVQAEYSYQNNISEQSSDVVNDSVANSEDGSK